MAGCLELDPDQRRELRLAARHPISRWYLCPLVSQLSRRLAASRVRPMHITYAGLAFAAAAGASILWLPDAWLPLAATWVLAAWFCDRLDGQLARRKGAETLRGAWLDANIDELGDLALHVCVAVRLAQHSGGSWPWLCLVAFVCGKYLLMYGVAVDGNGPTAAANSEAARPAISLRRLYHLPGNTDVRVHLLVLALIAGWLGAELVLVAIYYNLRWLARCLLVATRSEPGCQGAVP